MQALAQQQIVAAPVKVKTSQQQIIDQIHHHCQQTDTVIMLHGSDGSGKTTIAELFLEQASNYAECAFITVNERSTPDRLRAQILNQLFGTISLSDETLSRQIQRQTPLKHAVIVIDNGEQLSESFLAECVAAINQLSAVGQKVSIVIAADSRWAYQQKPAPHLRLQGPVMVEVQPLNKDEQVRFVQALLPERLQRLWNFDRIHQFLSTINGYPGEIQQRLQLALATQAQRYKEDTAPADSAIDEPDDDHVKLSQTRVQNKGRGIRLRYIIAIAMLISVAVAGFINKEQLSDWFSQAQSGPATAETPESAPEPVKAEAQQAPVELPSFEPLAEQSLALMPEDLAISYREALDDLNRVAAADNDPRELELGLFKEPKLAKAETVEPAAAPPQRALQTDQVMAADPQHFALQIAIITTEQLLTEFRNDYGLTDNTSVYQREDGRYVIIFGDYASLQQARDATSELPQAVQQMEPWAKSFAAMQTEIAAPVQQ